MTGLVKAKKYDWKDSNMALFGSDTDRQVKKESAETEPAWNGAGQEVGLKIWRVVKFEITDWDQEYGSFYDGDSYIILNTYQNEGEDELKFDVHFWIGKYSTQDEYGTAAYKTVELDTLLDDRAVQHREVMGSESALFRSYFKSTRYMKGGADTGFKHVEPEQYKPRLMHYSKTGKGIVVKEVSLSRDCLTPNDVFILDLGVRIIQWNGSESSGIERANAAAECQQLESERNGRAQAEVLDEADMSGSHSFYDALTEDKDDDDDDEAVDFETTLHKLSDAGGHLTFEEISKGDVSQAQLDPADVFAVETKDQMFVWVGSGASVDEKRNAISHAHAHLVKSEHPFLSITVMMDHQASTNKDFQMAVPA